MILSPNTFTGSTLEKDLLSSRWNMEAERRCKVTAASQHTERLLDELHVSRQMCESVEPALDWTQCNVRLSSGEIEQAIVLRIYTCWWRCTGSSCFILFCLPSNRFPLFSWYCWYVQNQWLLQMYALPGNRPSSKAHGVFPVGENTSDVDSCCVLHVCCVHPDQIP